MSNLASEPTRLSVLEKLRRTSDLVYVNRYTFLPSGLTISQSRTKVLVAAFSRSLRDPFVHARNASLQALAATADLFTEDECATKLLPAICPSLVDKEKYDPNFPDFIPSADI